MNFKKISTVFLLVPLLFSSCNLKDFKNYLRGFCGGRIGIIVNISTTIDGKTELKTYGYNGREMNSQPNRYFEIGSESKITLFYVVAKAILEGKVNPEDKISKYISISSDAYDPTIKELYTHCSAYGEYLPEHNFGRKDGINNPYYGVKQDTLINDLNSFKAPSSYSYAYSDFGMTVLNLVIERIYNKKFLDLAQPIWDDLGITNIGINYTSNQEGSFVWQEDDAYIPCMGISTTTEGLTKLANSLFRTDLDYVNLAANACNKYGSGHIGIGWRKYGNFYYQGGYVSHYSNYVGVDTEKKISAVITCNKSNKALHKMKELGDIYFDTLLD